MKTNRLALAVVTALCTLSAPAFATTINLNGSIANNTLLNSTSYTGSFNGAGVLPANYKINSLSFSFSFTDNANDAITYGTPQALAPTNGSYVQTNKTIDNDGTVNKYFERDVVKNYSVVNSSAQESVSLALAGITVGSGATSMTSSSTPSSTTSTPIVQPRTGYDTKCTKANPVLGNCDETTPGAWNYYTDNTSTATTTTLQDWSGSFNIAGTTTNQQIINQLLNTNALQFGLTVGGSVILAKSQLTLDVTAVPEPSTALLMLAALGGLGYSMRRRSAKQ